MVKDESKVASKAKYCDTYYVTEIETAESRMAAFAADLPYTGQTRYDITNNSVCYGKGAIIRLIGGYSIELTRSGWKVNYGNPNDIKSDQYAHTLADDMTRLLKYAEYQIKTPTETDAQLGKWSNSVVYCLGRSGIDTSKTFTVNGMEFVVENGIVKSTEKIRTDNAAMDAYNVLQIKNKTFNECSIEMKERLDCLFDYYCSGFPSEIKNIWYETMSECNINPFANNSCAIARMSLEKDIATGGDGDIFGSTKESIMNGISEAVSYLKKHGSMDTEFDNRQTVFFEKLLDKI